MIDEELWVSLFSGQGKGGDKAKRSWIGVVYIASILIRNQARQLQTFK